MTDIRVLLINDAAQLKGGAEAQVQREQRYLSEAGHTIKSVGFGDPAGESFTDDVISESDLFPVREIAGLSISVSIYRELRSIISHFDPDVIHIHKSQKYPATVALATRGYPSAKTHHDYSTVCPSAWAVKQDNYEVCECGVGAKCWQHGCRSRAVILGHYVPRHMIQKRIERFLIDEHIAPSQTLTEYLQEFGYDAQQIRNPESVRSNDNSGDDGFVLFIGRLSEEKGITVLLDAVDRVTDRYDNVNVKVAGSGPLQEEITDRTRDRDSIELLGYVSEETKSELFSNARAVVVPSIWMENYPTVVLESMAYGKPVIGSDRGGISEMVEHEYNGLLYPPLDSEQLATHLETVFQNQSKAHEMGANGRQWLQETSGYDVFGQQIEHTLQSLAQRG